MLKGGGLRFLAEGDAVWTGIGLCHLFDEKNKRMVGCKAVFDCDIIIKEGVIREIKNLRTPEWVK